MIEDARDYGVGQLDGGFGAGVELGVGGENCGAGQEEQFHVFDVDQIQRRFARDED
jgi:hypothetical protein